MFLNAALGFLLPSQCLLCQASVSVAGCCTECQVTLPWLGTVCHCCASPIVTAGYCGRCLAHPPPFQHTVIPFAYAAPINLWLTALKFHQRFEVLPFLVESLWHSLCQAYCEQAWPQGILPVPLHRHRLRQRGYNQALLLARQVARRTKIPLLRSVLTKSRVTEPQMGLIRSARSINLRRAFALTRSIPVSHIAIVDDVMTTGATVHEIATLLQHHGIQRIDVWCVARATLGL